MPGVADAWRRRRRRLRWQWVWGLVHGVRWMNSGMAVHATSHQKIPLSTSHVNPLTPLTGPTTAAASSAPLSPCSSPPSLSPYHPTPLSP